MNVVLGLSDVLLFFFFFQSSLRSFFKLKDIGLVQVKILRAEGLMAADVTGKITCHFLYSLVPSGTITNIPTVNWMAHKTLSQAFFLMF